jgi:NhaA family Na+:H+ antiporter
MARGSRTRAWVEWAFAKVLTPFEHFLRRTTAGGIVLMAATFVALALSAVWGDAPMHHFWEPRTGIFAGDRTVFALSLHGWVNEGLMTLFFLLVGLELKREILVGELSSLKDAALPVIAAAGGMVVPAAIFAALNPSGEYARGWGIPMATDIAFAVGIMVLLAWRVPRNLIVFLTALAIADDLGAVLVIALFYTAQLQLAALGAAAIVCGALLLLNLGGIRHPLPYAIAGVFLWVAVQQSGVHATLSGILLAACVPARGADCPLERWEHALTPWVTFVVIPVFALSNTGIDLTAIAWREAMASPLVGGIAAGLVIGKFVGIAAASWLAVKAGWGRLPEGVAWRHLLGAAWLGGIGFTMSLFIAQLAFDEAAHVELAKVGILCGSAAAAAAGLAWLWVAASAPGSPRLRT